MDTICASVQDFEVIIEAGRREIYRLDLLELPAIVYEKLDLNKRL